jgi:drug/metabolite transporter (DMT)-like permease
MAIRATDTKPLAPPIAYAYLVVIVVSWAGNWPLMKVALAAAPPLQFVVLRLAGTIALLAPILLAMRVPLLPVHGERLGLCWVGLLQVAGFLIFGIVGLATVPAGRPLYWPLRCRFGRF